MGRRLRRIKKTNQRSNRNKLNDMSKISTTFTDDRAYYGKKTKGRYEVPQEVSIRIQAEAKRKGIRKDKLVEEVLIKKFGDDRKS